MGTRRRPSKSGRTLKMLEDFSPCSVKNGDEIFQNGFFAFNITRMVDFIHSNATDFVVEEVAVDDFPREFSSIDEEHLESVQLGEPVILAEMAPGQYVLIDGNHRMEKARRLGIERVQAYRMHVEQHVRFLTSTVAYKAYVEYWNSKL